MHSFAQLTGIDIHVDFYFNLFQISYIVFLVDFPTIEFSPLLLSVIIITALIVGLVTGFFIHYIVGISCAIALIIICLIFVVSTRYLLRHKDYTWTASIAQFIKKRLEMLRFLLEVLFMNPYVHHRSKMNNAFDYQKMK